MEQIIIENLTFSYPQSEIKALNNINLKINHGEFIVICGKSGCGKTTLLRHLKSVITPKGTSQGKVCYEGTDIDKTDSYLQSSEIGFVMQNPDNQIVTDKVWHELSFGLENLGTESEQMSLSVAETAAFFGIDEWFDKKVTELSGGQKQILNLASVMAMHPKVLLLDEPTSQLDPIAAERFLNTVSKINKELGVTVILSEHRLEEAFCIADRIIAMQDGSIICDASPEELANNISSQCDFVKASVPSAVRIFSSYGGDGVCPITVRQGRDWLKTCKAEPVEFNKNESITSEKVIEISHLYFRYNKNDCDVIKNLSLDIMQNEIFAVLGSNASGKSTLASLISGIRKPYSGKIRINSKPIEKYKSNELYTDNLAVMPQNVNALFTQKSVSDDLKLVSSDIDDIVKLTEIKDVLRSHPFDLSGGEQQRVALAKVLLKRPKILILDEPTKGMDNLFKAKFAEILNSLKHNGCTVVMISHDIEFCAEYADRCALLFDGRIAACESTKRFFSSNHYYTTAASRMSRGIIDGAVTDGDVIECLKK